MMTRLIWMLMITLGLVVGLSFTGWPVPQKPKAGDYYWEQVGAALVGSLVGASPFVIALADRDETAWGGDKPSVWCTSRLLAPFAAVILGIGSSLSTDRWSQRRQIRGNILLSGTFATAGSFTVAYYLCQAAPRNPWLVLAAQVLAASLLAPLGYNMDAIIVPDGK